jgi:hypothetical protein
MDRKRALLQQRTAGKRHQQSMSMLASVLGETRNKIKVCVPTWCPVRARVSHAVVAAPSVSFFFRHASTALLLSAPLACRASSTTRSKQP